MPFLVDSLPFLVESLPFPWPFTAFPLAFHCLFTAVSLTFHCRFTAFPLSRTGRLQPCVVRENDRSQTHSEIWCLTAGYFFAAAC